MKKKQFVYWNNGKEKAVYKVLSENKVGRFKNLLLRNKDGETFCVIKFVTTPCRNTRLMF